MRFRLQGTIAADPCSRPGQGRGPSGSLFGLQLPDHLQRVADVLTDVGH
jgi:hypothetical protein